MSDRLRSWLFRTLMFEAEAEGLRDAGIRVGADERVAEDQLMSLALDPYPVAIRNAARRMGRLYIELNCFENSVRELIRVRLGDSDPDWWQSLVPKNVRERAMGRQEKALKNEWLEGAKGDPLEFAEFGDLTSIIVENWSSFEDLIPSQHWLRQRFDELENARNWIAHNRLLTDAEFTRVSMYVCDWNRQVGA